MELIPTQEEVVALLRRTGGLRDGHFEYPNGVHANEYIQVALTMRYYEFAKILSVSLSRKLRANPDIRVMIPRLSVVAPATGGLPVAYGICEALRAHQVYWSERDNADEPQHFREFLDINPARKCYWLMTFCAPAKSFRDLRRSWSRKVERSWQWLWWCISLIPTLFSLIPCRSTIWPNWTPFIRRMRRPAISASRVFRLTKSGFKYFSCETPRISAYASGARRTDTPAGGSAARVCCISPGIYLLPPARVRGSRARNRKISARVAKGGCGDYSPL